VDTRAVSAHLTHCGGNQAWKTARRERVLRTRFDSPRCAELSVRLYRAGLPAERGPPRRPSLPVPHKDFSDFYEKMSGKGESASEAHIAPARRRARRFVHAGEGNGASCSAAPAPPPVEVMSLTRAQRQVCRVAFH